MLEIEHLSFSYNKNIVLDDISFKISDYKIYTLFGLNGSGKTTLFKCILSIIKNYRGNIKIDGINVKQMNNKTLSKFVSYVPQQRQSIFSYTVLDTVLMGLNNRLNIYEKPNKKNKIDALNALKQLDIYDFKNRFYNELSGGEKQLVLIARAIAQNSKIIIMDEPTSALDYVNQTKVMNMIFKLKNMGYTILISLHNPELVLNFTDNIICLNNHKIIKTGKSTEILTSNFLKDLYNINLKIIYDKTGFAVIQDKKI